MDKSWEQKRKGPSPTLKLQCPICCKRKRVETSMEHPTSTYYNLAVYLILVAILLSGSTFERTCSLFNIMEMDIGSKVFYHRTVVPDVDNAVNNLLDDFLKWTGSQIKDKNDVFVVFDAGWSHPGWWARECTVLAVDGHTGLPIFVQHVIRGTNYEGSSRG